MAKSKYTTDFPQLAKEHAESGLSDKQIATKLGISEDTFYTYIKKYPEFSEALKEGKRPVDQEVENALLKKALGYTYEEVTDISTTVKDGKPAIKETRTTTKHVQGNTAAQIFWLCNRQADKWQNSNRVDITTKGDKINARTLIMTPEEIKAYDSKLEEEF